MSIGSDPLQEEKGDWLSPSYGWLLQLMAVVCIVMGLVYWAALTGMAGDELRRFDRLDTNPRIAYSVLAVTLPFAGLGLWFRSSWGVVVWLGCAALQLAMYGPWSATFGTNPLLLGYIALCVLALIVFNILFVMRWRANRLTGY